MKILQEKPHPTRSDSIPAYYPADSFSFLDCSLHRQSTSAPMKNQNSVSPSKIKHPRLRPATAGKNPTSKIIPPFTPSPLPTFSPSYLPTFILPCFPSHRVCVPHCGTLIPRRLVAAFTLVELLVVITIIGLLAGLATPAINGAIKAAKKSEVSAVAQSVRTAILAWNSEYGTWPTNGITPPYTTGTTFLDMMTTTNNANNPRGIIFLEVPSKFTNATGLVTPNGYIKSSNALFRFAVDTNGSGTISSVGIEGTPIRASCAVWAPDSAYPTTKSVGTWK